MTTLTLAINVDLPHDHPLLTANVLVIGNDTDEIVVQRRGDERFTLTEIR